jgi:putative aminopeptidase FrvX
MAKKTTPKSILTTRSMEFLERYLNNPSPTGFESAGQKLWLDYVRPYVDDHIVDPMGP